MNEKEIINNIELFYKSVTSVFPNIDSEVRGLFIDLFELYDDFVFEDENLNSKKPYYPNQLIFDNVNTLLSLIIQYCNEKDFEKIQTGLINLDIKLEHSQNHLKEARSSLKSIINIIGKMLPDDN